MVMLTELGGRTGRVWRALSVVLFFTVTAPATGRAHGRPAAFQSISAQPGHPDFRVAQATWGLAITEDGAESWQWVCAASMGVDARMEDPEVVVMGDGTILSGTFEGMLASDDHGCTWSRPSAELDDVYIVALVRAGAHRAYALAAVTGEADRIFRTDDDGHTWTQIGADLGDYLVDTLVVTPGDPERLYAGARTASNGLGERHGFILRSDDGGNTLVPHEVPLMPSETSVVVWAASPGDPDVVYATVTNLDGETAPQRVVRSGDGGVTTETVLAVPYVGGILVTEAGYTLVTSRLGGLYRADDGRTFEVIDEALPGTCLFEAPDQIVACIDQARGGAALESSPDGRVFEPGLRLSSIDRLVSCPVCTHTGVICPAWEPDIIYDLGLDAALPPGFSPDGGTGAPRDAGPSAMCRTDVAPGNCGCRTASPGSTPFPAWVALIAALAARRWRRHSI